MISCSTALISLLESYGVDTVFGIPGVHTIEFYRHLPATGIRHVTPRHEQGAGFMADGYARASGKPGVCLLITGPGVTNAVTAMAEAYSDSVPMLCISSVNQTSELGMGGGRLHELPSQRNLTSACTVFSHTVLDPGEIPHVLARAFAVFSSGRPGPVHIEIPINLLASERDFPSLNVQNVSRPGPDPRRITEAADLLANAKNAIVILGGGAVDASAEATHLIETLGCAAVTTIAGKGVVDEANPLSLGATLPFKGVQDLIETADVVLAVGTEFAETDLLYTGRVPVFNGKLIRIDIEAEQLVRNFFPEVPILSDARLALQALNTILGSTEYASVITKNSVQTTKDIQQATSNIEWFPVASQHQRILDVIQQQLPKNTIVACDSTQIAYTGSHYYPSANSRQWLFPLGFGTLGYGMPAALGAKLSKPDVPVICLSGDGGYLFTVQELATAVDEEIPIIVIVWNNGGYAEIRDAMVNADIPTIGVNLRTPDFVAMAKSFGCYGFAPQSLDELSNEIREACSRKLPTIIELHEDADFLV